MKGKRFEVYAPVIIPTLCRYEHFKRCIESLSRCTGAEFTEVFIGLDYPLKKEHEVGYKKICAFIPSIHGFKEVKVFKRDKNYGAVQNSLDLKRRVQETYDRFIISEDDNEFSPNFLEYMNDGLTRFKDNPDVIRICGCLMPWGVDFKKVMGDWNYNAFPAMDFNASGVGCWYDKLPIVPYTKDMVLHSWKLTHKAFQKGYCTAISRMLYQLKKETQLPDVCIRLYCAFHHKYCIFPTISKVKNWGYDGTGLNSDNDSRWIEVQKLDTSATFEFDDFEIKEYKEVKRFIGQIFDVPPGFSKLKWRWRVLKSYIFYRITGIRFQDLPQGERARTYFLIKLFRRRR